MDKAAAALLLIFSACSLLICLTSAKNTVCFNANGKIKRVFCEGRDITGYLTNRNNPRICDCMEMDVCKNITLRVSGYQHRDKGQSKSGISVCQTTTPTPYRDWVCMKSSMNRNWESQTMNTKNHEIWRRAQRTNRAKRCYGKQTQPCTTQMFWNAGVDASSIDCVLKQCGDECRYCGQTGPGKCDPGMCNFGVGVNNITGKTRCNRRCRLDLKPWGWRQFITTKGHGYMRLVDLRSNSVDIIRARKPGYYLAIIDIDRCAFTNKTYSPWVPSVRRINLPLGKLSEWIDKEIGTLTNRLAAVLQVGGIDGNTVDPAKNQWYSGAPYGEVFRLGNPEGPKPLFTPSGNRNCSVSAVFTGFNYGPTKLESFVVHKRGTSDNANSGC